MSEPENGGSAFPASVGNANESWTAPGMTLRDYFAAAAVQGILSNKDHSEWCGDELSKEESIPWYQGIAEYSYTVADSMLQARKK